METTFASWGHNVDIRKLWTNIDDAEYLCDKLDVPNCRIVIRVDREVWSPDRVLLSHDIRYFLTSLDPGTVTPEDLAHLVRDHWQVGGIFRVVKPDRRW